MEGESSTCTYDELESIILDGSSGPCSLPLEYLRRITNNFSDERLLGQGGFGKVYKGVLQNGKMVAIKRLDQLLKPEVQERQFQNEVFHLMRLKHPNIVRFLGYCYEIQNECVEYDGKYCFAEKPQNLICLEYLPNGSLDRHLSDESCGHEWHTRYKIIKGICCGLLYLHEECQCQFGASIIHLDLKPGNILLDEYMGPKITDFGLSRLFIDNKTQIATFLSGSLGYMAPEYLIRRIVTAKADIYNLGVIIIEIITGTKVDIFSFSSPTSCQKFVDGVINNWRNRLGGALSETDCKQIKCCLEIGLGCIKFNREERPTSREIMERLDRWETKICNVNGEKRSAADQILKHMEEKPSASTTSYESIFCALQPNITGVRVRSTAATNDNTNTNTASCNVNSEKRSAADQTLKHMEEKPSASTTGYESIFCAPQPNITGVRVRSTATTDDSSSTNTGHGTRSYGSPNRSRVRSLFLPLLSGVMRFLSGVLRFMPSVHLSRPLSLSLEGTHDNDNDDDGDEDEVKETVLRFSAHGDGDFGFRFSEDDDDEDGDKEQATQSRATVCRRIRLCRRHSLSLSLEGTDDEDKDEGEDEDEGENEDEVTEFVFLSLVDDPEEFTFAQMEAATMGFSVQAKIGEGSFGTVYHGYLPDGREVAIKRGFQMLEVSLLSHLCHKHLIHLVGYCAENDERLLVYKYMKNGALYDHLHSKAASSSSPSPSTVLSSWKLRIRILLDASRGLEYLHSQAIAHRDIKSSNILLDASWRASLSGFGLSLPERLARVHQTVAGTVGYMDPEYYSQHYLTVKSDVYGFGVVMLEMLTGKPAAILEEAEGASPLRSVVDYAVPSIVSGEFGKVLDPRVPEPAAHEAEALGLVAYTALHCVQLKGKDRPGMAGIVANLETAFALCEGNLDGDIIESPSSHSLSVITPIDEDGGD